MLKAYVSTLYRLMQQDQNVYSLLSDSGTEYDTLLAREFPDRCFNFGIAEENKVGAASGMAAIGKIPFIQTSGAFLAYRSYEFIRNDICIQQRNVKIVGSGSGLSIPALGPSHHCTEDIAALRVIPNLLLLSPASPKEMEQCVEAAYQYHGPVYIRAGMTGEPEIYDEGYQFQIGTPTILKDGSDATLFVTGSIAANAVKAAESLRADHISLRVVNISTLSNIDLEKIAYYIQNKVVFSLEEHSIVGGLGGILSEVIADLGLRVKLVRIGLYNQFASGYGSYEEVREKNHLGVNHICSMVQSELSK